MLITFTHQFFFSMGLILLLGFAGIVLNRHNIVILILSFEFIYLVSNLIFAYTSFQSGNCLGIFYVIYNITIVGAEACIGLASISLYYFIVKAVFLNGLNACKL